MDAAVAPSCGVLMDAGAYVTQMMSAIPGVSSGVPVTVAQPWLGVHWAVVVAPLVGGHGRLRGSPRWCTVKMRRAW